MSSSFKDLTVWQKSMDLVREIYILIRRLPNEEKYGLSDQMRRAAVSIPSNIAEGQRRRSQKDFHHFLAMADGSCAELETQLLIAVKLNMLTDDEIADAMDSIDAIERMLNSLMSSLRSSTNN